LFRYILRKEFSVFQADNKHYIGKLYERKKKGLHEPKDCETKINLTTQNLDYIQMLYDLERKRTGADPDNVKELRAIFMKKLLEILVLGLLVCRNSFAVEMDVFKKKFTKLNVIKNKRY